MIGMPLSAMFTANKCEIQQAWKLAKYTDINPPLKERENCIKKNQVAQHGKE